MLKKQAKELEEIMIHYGLVLPSPYSNVRPVITSVEPVEDRFMFMDILRGMQDAQALHGTAIQDIVLNDGLRRHFKKLTLDEVSTIDKMIKLGRARGWTVLIPTFGENR